MLDSLHDFINGWTTQLTNENDWYVGTPILSGVTPPDGVYTAFATCFKPHDASWLYSPEFTPKEGEQLMFDLYFDARSLFVWTTEGDDKNIDVEDGLILKRENAENMKVCISVDGGEWVELKNLWEDFSKLGYWDIIYDYEYPEFRHFTIDLSEYAGKNVKLGFCHQYLNENFGYGMFLDAVRVSLPPVETSYMLPMGLMFYGITDEMMPMYHSAIVPYNTPLTWPNMTSGEDLSYKWEYSCPTNEGVFTSEEMDLVSSYAPDFSENPDAPYTIYSFPTVSATNEAGTTGTYTYGDGEAFIFAGSHPNLEARDGSVMKFGMTTFDPADDMQVYNADFDLPAYGHCEMSRDWWTNHYFEGTPKEGDYAEITANMNFFYATGSPIVIEGVRVVSSVVCDPDAEFLLEIIGLNDEFVPSELLASASLKGSDLIAVDASFSPYPNTHILSFRFDEPLVVDGKNFIAKVSGFNSDKVTYYAPIQSFEPRELCYAFAELHIVSPSEQQDGRSMIPATGENDGLVSYLMMLDANYPYLNCEESEFAATADQTSKTFNFESSYPAEELEVKDASGKLPEWIEVEKSGRYGNTKLTFTVKSGGSDEEANLTVSAPGVSKELVIKRGTVGVNDITDAAVVVERQMFDLSGRRLAAEPADGVYIVKTIKADGSTNVEKVVK